MNARKEFSTKEKTSVDLTVLLKCNLYAMQFTCFKCTMDLSIFKDHCCGLTLEHFQYWCHAVLQLRSSPHSNPHLEAIIDLLSLQSCLFWTFLRNDSYSVWPFASASLDHHSVFEAQPCCRMYQCRTPA